VITALKESANAKERSLKEMQRFTRFPDPGLPRRAARPTKADGASYVRPKYFVNFPLFRAGQLHEKSLKINGDTFR
jgi:hypothetical protein